MKARVASNGNYCDEIICRYGKFMNKILPAKPDPLFNSHIQCLPTSQKYVVKEESGSFETSAHIYQTTSGDIPQNRSVYHQQKPPQRTSPPQALPYNLPLPPSSPLLVHLESRFDYVNRSVLFTLCLRIPK